MSKTVQFEVDTTQLLYQDRPTWLESVHAKFGETTAQRCASIVGPEIETMDQLEAKAGLTIDAVLKQARRDS